MPIIKHNYDYGLKRNEMQQVLDDYVYNDYHRLLLEERIICKHTFEEIAFNNNTSVTTVKRIIYSYDDRLKEWTKM